MPSNSFQDRAVQVEGKRLERPTEGELKDGAGAQAGAEPPARPPHVA